MYLQEDIVSNDVGRERIERKDNPNKKQVVMCVPS
jgi:hypothetical protein